MSDVSTGLSPPLDQSDAVADDLTSAGRNIFSSKSLTLLLALLWTVAAFGLSFLKLGPFISGSILWFVGLALAVQGFRTLKIETAKQNQALKKLQDWADQMERRVVKRSSSLHLRQRQLQALMDNVSFGVFLKNNHYEFILVNHHLSAMINVPVERLLASDGYGFLEPATALKVKELEQKVITGKRALELYDMFDQVSQPNGRIVILRIFPVINPEGSLEGIGGLLIDVTDQHRQEGVDEIQGRGPKRRPGQELLSGQYQP